MFNFLHNKKKIDFQGLKSTFSKQEFEIISTLTSSISSRLDLDRLLQDSADLAVNTLRLHGCILFLKETESNYIYTKTISQSNQSRVALKMLRVDNFKNKLRVSLEQKDNLVVDTFLNNKENISDNLWKFTIGVLGKSLVNLIQKATVTGSSISIPITSNKDVVGVLLFTKREEKSDWGQERLILRTYANQIGIAIQNSNLFEKSQKQIEVLQKKNKELQSLYNLTSRVSQSLDPNEVAQIAVDSLPQDEFMIGGILSMLDEPKEKIYTRALTRNQISESVEKIIGTIDQYYIDYNDERFAGSPLVQAIKQAKPIFTNNIESFLNPPIPKTFIPAVKKILNIKSLAVFPIFIKGDLLGGLTFFLKNQTAEEISQNTHSLLQTYTYQIAIALDNARLYRQTIEIQASLQNALGQLQEARRKEKDMVDIMGHELRTPMSIVKNALAMLHMYTQKNQPISYDKLKKYVDIGIESARRETNLIETLLSATKADAKGFQLTLEKVDLLDVINDSLVAFNTQAKKKGLDIIYNKDENQQLFIYADRIRIQEVIDNFLSNAVKYTNKGYIKIYLEDKDDLYWIHIEDTGFGIGEEDLKNLGRKFYRAQQHLKNDKDGVIRPGGTGLGLYVSFALVKIMNGKYKVQSTLGKGSRFSFGMPKFVGQETTQVERKVMDYAKTTEGE